MSVLNCKLYWGVPARFQWELAPASPMLPIQSAALKWSLNLTRWFFIRIGRKFKVFVDGLGESSKRFALNFPPEGLILRPTDSLKCNRRFSPRRPLVRQWCTFHLFASRNILLPVSFIPGPVLPVPGMLPCICDISLTSRTLPVCRIDAAVYGSKWAHTMAGIPSPTDSPVIEGARFASKRILGFMRSPKLGGMIFSFMRVSWSLRFSKQERPTS